MIVNIFDFDKTLADTPNREQGVVQYFKKTGKSFEHKGWFGRIESLDNSIHDIKLYPNVLSKIDKNAVNYLLTGRIPKMTDMVYAILNDYLPYFSELYFNNKGKTIDFKIDTLKVLFERHGIDTTFNFYDDRVEHIKPFFDFFKKNKKYNVNHFVACEGDVYDVVDIKSTLSEIYIITSVQFDDMVYMGDNHFLISK